ncbi:MAG TPA: hypothetical protein VFO37_07650, partial [Chitinophagaceae bacterium]|nr:hypothetical protein [Chitinophagaceae bacterium]
FQDEEEDWKTVKNKADKKAKAKKPQIKTEIKTEEVEEKPKRLKPFERDLILKEKTPTPGSSTSKTSESVFKIPRLPQAPKYAFAPQKLKDIQPSRPYKNFPPPRGGSVGRGGRGARFPSPYQRDKRERPEYHIAARHDRKAPWSESSGGMTPRNPPLLSSKSEFNWPQTQAEFQKALAANPQEFFKILTPMFSSLPPQGTSFAQATETGTMDFSKTLLPGTLSTSVGRDPIKTYKQTGKPGQKYRKSEGGRQLTASPSGSDTDSKSKKERRRPRSESRAYAPSKTRAPSEQESESKPKTLRRLAKRSLEARLFLPAESLEPKGSKLRYFIGSSIGAIATGMLIPSDSNNWSQDVQDLHAKKGVPSVIQCGHRFAASLKQKKFDPNKLGYENPYPLDVGETIVVTKLAWFDKLPQYQLENPGLIPKWVNSEDVTPAQAV